MTDLKPLLEWCNSEYTPLPEIAYEDEGENARTTATSIYTTFDICNHFRDSLKPKFKLLASKINEVSEEIGNVDFSNCVMKSELKRDDTIDVIATKTLEHITLKAEDTITNGTITFKVFIANTVNPYIFSITFLMAKFLSLKVLV